MTPPGAWRVLRQLAATLRQAIAPQPTVADLYAAKNRLKRHFHEPPRSRTYQSMAWLF